MKALTVIRTEGWKSFIEKWKAGITMVTPEQSTKQQINFTKITMVGIVCGMGVSLYYAKYSWWIAIILLGALGNSWVQLMALKQKYKLLNSFSEERSAEDIKPPQSEGGLKNGI